MKTLKIFTVILVALFYNSVSSQVSQDPKTNEVAEKASRIANLPLSPKTKIPFRYFYYPNLQAYFDNLYNVYYYRLNGVWVVNDELPPVYCGYSLFNNRKVVIEDFIDDKPYELVQIHKTKYPYNSKGRFSKEEI